MKHLLNFATAFVRSKQMTKIAKLCHGVSLTVLFLKLMDTSNYTDIKLGRANVEL